MKIYFYKPHISLNTGASSFIGQLINYINSEVKSLEITSWRRSDVVFMSGEAVNIQLALLSLLSGKYLIYRVDGLRKPFHDFAASFGLHGANTFAMCRYYYLPLLKNITNSTRAIIIYLLAGTVIHQSMFVETCWNRYFTISRLILMQKKKFVVLNSFSRTSEFSCAATNNSDFTNLFYSKGTLPISSTILDSLFSYLLMTDKSQNIEPIHLDLFGSTRIFQLNKNYLHVISALTKHSINLIGSLSRNLYFDAIKNCRYHAFVLLEDFAACPNSVIEAMSFGIPVLGPNTGSFPELASDNELIIDVSQVNVDWQRVLGASRNYPGFKVFNHVKTHLGKENFKSYADIILSSSLSG